MYGEKWAWYYVLGWQRKEKIFSGGEVLAILGLSLSMGSVCKASDMILDLGLLVDCSSSLLSQHL